jgi:hypothetical protein
LGKKFVESSGFRFDICWRIGILEEPTGHIVGPLDPSLPFFSALLKTSLT